jgi:quinol monooxygenase YgiN
MINVIASIHVKEGRRSEFIDIFKSNVPKVLEEKGCIAYVPTLDVPTGLPPQELNRNVVTIIEKWESLKDLQAHLTAPHMLTYKEKVKDLVENVSLKILEEV